MREPLVFSALPALRRTPFIALADGPTPITPIEGPGFADRVFAKREDRSSAIYGGNKVRRLELLFGAANERGARTILTAGGLASTQVTATIVHGVRLGFDVRAVLFDQPETPFVRESLAMNVRAGGRLVHGGSYARTAALFLREEARAFRPFVILPGASTPLCNLSYVDAMLEVAASVERGELPRPTRIVAPCGSGGTVAGLAVGAALLGWNVTVVGVRITALAVSNRFTVAMLVDATARLVEKRGGPSRARLTKTRVEIDHRFIGKGYGFSTPDAERGARRIERVIGRARRGHVLGQGILRRSSDKPLDHPRDTLLFFATLSSTGRTPERVDVPEGTPTELRRFFAH